jgi:hypothetical protein
MKTIIYLLFLLLLFSCNNKKFISENQQVEFNLCNSNLLEINVSLENYEVDSQAYVLKYLQNRFNFHNSYYYSKIANNLFVLYHYYDYGKTLTLVKVDDFNDKTNNALYYHIATITGDGGEFYYKKSTYKNGVFYSSFIEGYRSLTNPIDTVLYKFKGTSIIKILPNGIIKEDTISLKRNFIEYVDSGYLLENNF